MSLRIFDEDDATNSECPASASSSEKIADVDATDDPFDGVIPLVSTSSLPAATACVYVPFIVCVTLEICLCAFV